ncbi:hypothetical protein [Prosthecochloris sp. HL-130-GSB]|uniref:hypothetical protein n=1 Tax=Prosthecochloris sp. HL-130-GSB TaxID=1974213 RepID=UPI0012F49254|nr:hypothetical protein [Prosthecochloris sp. HL-130-GSB]
MPANLLILPYIAGFWFISRCYLAKYRAQRHDGYRLLFYSAIAGLAFLMVPLFLEYVLFFFGLLPAGKHLEHFFPFLSSFGIQGIGTALTATIFGIASPLPSNQERSISGFRWSFLFLSKAAIFLYYRYLEDTAIRIRWNLQLQMIIGHFTKELGKSVMTASQIQRFPLNSIVWF